MRQIFYDTTDLYDEEIALRLISRGRANPKKRWAPTYYFAIVRLIDEVVVGHCDFRIGNTEKLFFGGNIGYHVLTSYRGHHYAAKACLLLRRLAQRHEMPYLIITCNPENHASRKTCENVGGVLLGVVDLPTDNDMYRQGERRKLVYKVLLQAQTGGKR